MLENSQDDILDEQVKAQIISNLTAMVNEILFALKNNKSFIFSAVVDGQQYPVSIAGQAYCTREILEAFKKNDDNIYQQMSKLLDDKETKPVKEKQKTVVAEIKKADNGNIIINFDK